MIRGTGIDILEIDRIRNILDKFPVFLQRVFNEEEITYFKSRKLNVSTIAGGFAAKEAVIKAIGTGLRNFSWKDVSILRDELGGPVVCLKGKARLIAQCRGIDKIQVSISHSRRYAVAQAIAIGGKGNEDCHIGTDEVDR